MRKYTIFDFVFFKLEFRGICIDIPLVFILTINLYILTTLYALPTRSWWSNIMNRYPQNGLMVNLFFWCLTFLPSHWFTNVRNKIVSIVNSRVINMLLIQYRFKIILLIFFAWANFKFIILTNAAHNNCNFCPNLLLTRGFLSKIPL